MRTIIHLSDLHFLRSDSEVVTSLVSEVSLLQPDAVVISGDLTQRAKVAEYTSVAEFIRKLPNVKVVVPGNHDIPLYNVFLRFLSPLRRYKRFIGKDIEPVFSDDEVTIIGVNTSRSFVFKGGRISDAQIDRIESVVKGLPKNSFKMLVFHHPFEEFWNDPTDRLIGAGINAFLFGHRHKSNYTQVTKSFGKESKSGLLLQGGTATSTRYRNENNSFTVIKVQGKTVTVDLRRWDTEKRQFFLVSSTDFQI